MATVIPEKKIKSASRVLEILELFDEGRQEVTVMDVARSLDYPQSSTSELLACLVKQGYLVRDRSARTYRPTARVPLLGAWVQPSLFRHGKLLPMMDELHDDCGNPVILSSMVGVGLKHVHVVGKVPSTLRAGTEHSLMHSPLAHALLSHSTREMTRKLIHRLNSETVETHRVRYEDFANGLDDVRKRGFSCGQVAPALAALGVLLPQTAGQELLSLGVILPEAEIDERRDGVVRDIRSAVSRHLGPVIASGASHYQGYARAG